MIVAAEILRLSIWKFGHIPLQADPWVYRFFPVEVGTFLLGSLGYHVYALKEGTVGFYEPMSEMMLNTVFPMWSQVVGHDEFDAMLQASTTSGQASAK